MTMREPQFRMIRTQHGDMVRLDRVERVQYDKVHTEAGWRHAALLVLEGQTVEEARADVQFVLAAGEAKEEALALETVIAALLHACEQEVLERLLSTALQRPQPTLVESRHAE